MKQIFTFLLALVFSSSVLAQNVGQVPPDFRLKDLSEMDYVLSENKGKVIMVFLIGNNCPFCVGSAQDIKSQITGVFNSNDKFQAVVIDVWDGNKSSVQGFKNSTNLNASYLQKGSGVASSWSSTHDRIFVIGSDGKMVFRGTSSAKSQVASAKSAIQFALDNVVTAAPFLNLDSDFELTQNYPNPFVHETKIGFKIGEAAEVRLQVFDITGKQVAEPLNDFYTVGEYDITLQRNQLKNGIYFYRFSAGNFVAIKRMVVQ